MGPIALFDKSFLEGLNVDEAVLFDFFFYPVTCPIFYVETLADLDKPANRGRTAEEVVGSIAFKTPQMHGGPNVYHRTLVLENLMGREIPMTGQIMVAGGIPVQVNGETGVVFRKMPEAEAFSRWQQGEFEEIERAFATQWRQELRTLSLHDVAAQAKHYGLDLNSCRTIEEAQELADLVISSLPPKLQVMFAIDKFHVPAELREPVLQIWQAAGEPILAEFAPYAHFVLRTQVFFEVALATGKISADRPSNLNDIAYLFYLPFCMVFLSTDRLHRTCAPLFMRPDQQFLWGEDVKADLQANHVALMELPEAERNRGLLSMSPRPQEGGLIASVYKTQFKVPRETPSRPFPRSDGVDRELAAKLRSFNEAATHQSGAPQSFNPNDAQSMTIERYVHKRRGSWFQVPHDTQPTPE